MAHASQRIVALSPELPTEMACTDADAECLAMRVRGVPAPDASRLRTSIAWACTLLLHLWLLLAWYHLRPLPLEGRDSTPMQVELIVAPIPPPAVAPLVVEPLPHAVSTPAITPAGPPAAHRSPAKPESPIPLPTTPTTGAVQDVPAMRFYNPDSSANIPKDLLLQIQRNQAKPNFIAKEFVQPEFMQHKNPLHYLATDFEPTWVPVNEDLLSEFVRRHLTREVTFKTPWGGTIRCTWVFVMGACAGVPPPAWKNPDEKKALPPPAPEWQ